MKAGIVLNTKVILCALLALSLTSNVYLFLTTMTWQKAWLEQSLTTSEIERIFRKSGADISFQSIQRIVSSEYKGSFMVLSKNEVKNEPFGPYENIIIANETRLFFNNNEFVGSKANLPPKTNYWWFNQ
jgi:hypothetical protein